MRTRTHGFARVAWLVVAAVAWMVAVVARAAPDIEVAVPAGWHANALGPWHSAGGRLALAVASAASPAQAGLMQLAISGVVGTIVTPMPGRILDIEVSSAGSHVLVRAQLTGEPVTTTLVGAGGSIDWILQDDRWLAFSNTGQSIVAWDPRPVGPNRGHVEVLNLAGVSLHTWQAAGRPVDSPVGSEGPLDLNGALAVGDGHAIIVGLGRAVALVALAGTAPAVTWARDLRPRQLDVARLAWLDHDTMLLDQRAGRFTCISADGEEEYFFRPWLPWGAMEAYVPHAIPGSRTILLYAETEEALVVEPVTGEIRPLGVNREAPAGYEDSAGVSGYVLLFTRPLSVVIRGLP